METRSGGARRPDRRVLWALAGVAVLIAARPGWSQGRMLQPASKATAVVDPARRVEALYAEGVALFRAGAYREALARFETAYGVLPVPNLLYNIGRSLEALGELDRALASYRRCMDHPESSGEARLRAAQRYESLVQARVTGARATRPPAVVGAQSTDEAPEPVPGAWRRTVGWTIVPVGLAALAAGAVSFVLGARDHSSIEDLPGYGDPEQVLGMTRSEALNRSADGRRKKEIAVGLLAAGGALALAGGALLIWPAARGERRAGEALSRPMVLGLEPVGSLTSGAAVTGAEIVLRGGF